MTILDKTSTGGQTVNVGMYGRTQAGKTRFLFHLLNGWKEQDRLLPQSEAALSFLSTVRAEIETHGKSAPTVATTEGIKVSVRNDDKEPSLKLVFRDLRGELLSDELDQIDSLSPNGIIPNQVRQCDAFLFFFDPTCSDDPADIERHYRRELKRAEMFIEYVLGARQNRHLPIVFVLTHLDKWEHDETIRTKANDWQRKVNATLRKRYASWLRQLHPETIVDLKCTTVDVSSVTGTGVETVVKRVRRLVADSLEFQGGIKKPAKIALWAGIAVIALLPFAIWLLSIDPGGNGFGSKRPASSAPETEKEALVKLDEFDRVLKGHPLGSKLPSIAQAAEINHHLQWLSLVLELGPQGRPLLSEKTWKRIHITMDTGADVVAEKAETTEVSAADQLSILAAYLENVQDLKPLSEKLAKVQSDYWLVQREHSVEQIGGILRRRQEVASSPIDTLGEVLNKLRGLEQEVSRSKVFGPQRRQDLIQEIQNAATFCEDRKNSKTYPARFRIVSARKASKKASDLDRRNLTLTSPGRTDEMSRDGVALIPSNTEQRLDLSVKVLWGKDCWDGYKNSIKVGINGVVLWDTQALSLPNRESKLEVKRLVAKPSDAVNFSVDILALGKVWNSPHGADDFSTSAGQLLDKVFTRDLGVCGNKVVLTADWPPDHDRPDAFHTQQESYSVTLGLGTPIVCGFSVHNNAGGGWRKLYDFDLTDPPTKQGPLAALGLPLLRPEQPEVTKHVQWEGYELKLEFSKFPHVPPLLWDAGASIKERKP